MATKNRTDLKSYFVKNAIPTEGNFADLIDSQLNQTQDGVFKPDGDALSVIAAPGDQKRVLRLYTSYPAANPDWMISLNPAQDPATAATTGKPGFGIIDSRGKTRLFIDAASNNIGIGTNTPQFALDVAGAVGALRFRPRYDTALNDYRTSNPVFGVGLEGPPGNSDAWIYRAPATPSGDNWGIYHREINSPVGGLPANSIGFVGGGSSKAQAYVSLDDGSGFFAGNLTVSGKITAAGGMQGGGSTKYDLVLNNYQTVNPSSNVCLPGPPSDRDAWIYRASDSSSNWGIYHRDINTAVAGLPANSIGFVGGGANKLQAYVNLGDGSGYFAGKVGIGSGATSDYKLDVRGYSILTDPDSKFNSHFPHTDNCVYITGENIYLRGGATNVGTILTAASSDKSVEMAGNLVVQGSSLMVKGAGNEQCYLGADGSGNDVELGSKNANITKISAYNPTTRTGMDFTCRSLIQVSDARSKDNIEPIMGALTRIVRLCGVSFDWKADNRVEGAPKHLGFIAQQVREVVPEAVVDAREGSLSIVYNAITALLVEAVKEQQQHIDELRAALTPAPVH